MSVIFFVVVFFLNLNMNIFVIYAVTESELPGWRNDKVIGF